MQISCGVTSERQVSYSQFYLPDNQLTSSFVLEHDDAQIFQFFSYCPELLGTSTCRSEVYLLGGSDGCDLFSAIFRRSWHRNPQSEFWRPSFSIGWSGSDHQRLYHSARSTGHPVCHFQKSDGFLLFLRRFRS